MSERKVLNKYYPPDYDPSNIPRAKRPKNRQWTIRTMAPFNMRCNTCGEYIYKGKKFNSRQELADGETYLGLKIFRFYIKCPRCVAEISFKTDPENVDYQIEAGATRNFEALRTAELMAEREAKEKEEELENNPMKMLENRTKASQREMDMLETLEDLKDMNSKHAKVDTEEMILKYRLIEEKRQQLQDEEDEKFVQSVFGKSGDKVVRRLDDDDDDDSSEIKPGPSKKAKLDKPTDFLTDVSEVSVEKNSTDKVSTNKKAAVIPKKSVGLLSTSKAGLGMLVKKKQQPKKTNDHSSENEKMNSENSNNTKNKIDDNTNSLKNQSKNSTTETKNEPDKKQPIGASGGLSLLGSYSDSYSDSDDE